MADALLKFMLNIKKKSHSILSQACITFQVLIFTYSTDKIICSLKAATKLREKVLLLQLFVSPFHNFLPCWLYTIKIKKFWKQKEVKKIK